MFTKPSTRAPSLLCLLWLAVFPACGKKIPLIRPPSAIGFEVIVKCAAELNQGNAVVLYIYPLQDDKKFREATPETFWPNGEKALEKDVLGAKQAVTLYPGQTRTLSLKAPLKTKFLGLAADFYAPDPARWRQVVPVSVFRGRRVTVEAGKDFLKIAGR